MNHPFPVDTTFVPKIRLFQDVLSILGVNYAIWATISGQILTSFLTASRLITLDEFRTIFFFNTTEAVHGDGNGDVEFPSLNFIHATLRLRMGLSGVRI